MPFARWLFAVRLLIHFSQVLHGCDSDNGVKVLELYRKRPGRIVSEGDEGSGRVAFDRAT